MTTPSLPIDRASSASDRPGAPATGLAATVRRVAAFLAEKARRFAGVVRATGARVAAVLAEKLSIPPATVLPLALAALVIVAIVLSARRA